MVIFPSLKTTGLSRTINAAAPDILLVGMGTPCQEKWIKNHAHDLKATVIIGVGGLFDFYSGRNPRAPIP